MTIDDKTLQDDQAWFDSLNGKGESAQAARLRQVLYEAELADAAKEDTTHDWQRLQFALKREKAKPESHISWHKKYYPIAASVLIVVCASSVIFETIKEPGYSPTAPAPVAASVSVPPHDALAPPVAVSPPVASTHSTNEHARLKAKEMQIERKREEDSKLMAQRLERDSTQRSVQMDGSAPPPEVIIREAIKMAPAPAAVSTRPATPRVTVMSNISDQTVFTDTPEHDADQLEAQLTQLGISIVRNNAEDKFILHISLTYPVKPEVSDVLKKDNIQTPEQGQLTVTFMSSSK